MDRKAWYYKDDHFQQINKIFYKNLILKFVWWHRWKTLSTTYYDVFIKQWQLSQHGFGTDTDRPMEQ